MMRGGKLTSKGTQVVVLALSGLILIGIGFYFLLPGAPKITGGLSIVDVSGQHYYSGFNAGTYSIFANPVTIYDSRVPASAGQVGISINIGSSVTSGTPVSWVIQGYTTQTVNNQVVRNQTFSQAGSGAPPATFPFSPPVLGGATVGLSTAIQNLPLAALSHATVFNGGVVFGVQGTETVTFADGSTQTQTFSYPNLVSLSITVAPISGYSGQYTIGVS